ncbi:hypothetical protein AKJ50_01245 [candidate division MSBL1 archaeon SCGC-AAA382A13]|uniref:Orotate phosphoribosyltransferase n=1 Tax=candidate division MSBL1 archaeon SCGC-AAA382A13 TaxID=1698279 RepID=A0A133VFW6_9EURY|nr:hypothetical protein AKJ50_01245 [candidate division MSBL1 archaeon SCGC-AAA382A13]
MEENRKKNIAKTIHEIKGIKFGEFTLTSGKTSPYYVDLRIIPSYPNLLKEIGEICALLIEDEIKGEHKIAGVPTSGLPFATVVSQKLELPLLYVRKKKKSHGQKKNIEGEFEEGKIVLIDDVSTTGGSLLDAVETIRDAGGSVRHAVVVLDREEGAEENLRQVGVDLHACFSISDLIEYLKEYSIVDDKKYSMIMNYLEER